MSVHALALVSQGAEPGSFDWIFLDVDAKTGGGTVDVADNGSLGTALSAPAPSFTTPEALAAMATALAPGGRLVTNVFSSADPDCGRVPAVHAAAAATLHCLHTVVVSVADNRVGLCSLGPCRPEAAQQDMAALVACPLWEPGFGVGLVPAAPVPA